MRRAPQATSDAPRGRYVDVPTLFGLTQSDLLDIERDVREKTGGGIHPALRSALESAAKRGRFIGNEKVWEPAPGESTESAF